MNAATLAAQMRMLLAARGTPPPDAAETAQRWASLMTDAQRRLEQAVSWAARGLRTEAIGLAQSAPSIFETATTAWDPSLAGWDDYCQRHHFARPPIILRPAVERLSECALRLEPARAALARWRKLNIGRAPATERLDQMRLLRQLDPDTPAWLDDAPALERLALQEVVASCERSLALWEIERVWNAIRWIESGEWVEAPAKAATATLRERVRELSGRSALDRARGVVARLHGEYMAESVDAATEHLREWEALRAFLAESGVDPPADLAESVRPVVEWIRERQEASQRLLEHRTNAAELKALIEAPSATLAECERLLDTVESGPEPIEPQLRSAARRRIATLQRERLIRRTALVGACVIVAAALLTSALWIIERHNRSVRAEQFLAKVDQSIARDDLEGLDDLVDRMVAEDPRLAATAAPAEAQRRVANARAERLRNDASFEAGLAAAGDPASPEARSDAMDALEPFARTAEQRARLESWRDGRRRAESSRQQARDLAFAQALAELEQALGRIASEGDAASGSSADDDALAGIRARLDALERSPGVSAPAMARARPVRLRLETLERAQEQRMALARALAEEALEIDALLPLIRDPHAYAAGLRRFGESRPASPHAEGFLDAAIDEPAWRAALSWPAAVAGVSGPVAALNEARRDEARRALRAFVEAHPRAVHAEAARAALDHLQPSNEWRRWLTSVLDASPIFSLRTVRLRNGERYYYEALQPPQPTSDGVRVYRVVKRLRDPGKGLFDTEFVRIDPRQIVEDGDSPQMTLARELRAALRAGELDGVIGLLTVIGRIGDATAVDAVLRAELLAGLLERLERAAPALAPALAPAAQRLAEEHLDRIEWLDPRVTEGRDRSREVDASLPRIIESTRWREAWRSGAMRADQGLAVALEPVGMLLRVDGAATARFARAPTSGELIALRAGGDRDDGMFVVGRVDASGEVSLDAAHADELPSGTPLFQRRAAGAAGAAPAPGIAPAPGAAP